VVSATPLFFKFFLKKFFFFFLNVFNIYSFLIFKGVHDTCQFLKGVGVNFRQFLDRSWMDVPSLFLTINVIQNEVQGAKNKVKPHGGNRYLILNFNACLVLICFLNVEIFSISCSGSWVWIVLIIDELF
jgi:hypothetical protein